MKKSKKNKQTLIVYGVLAIIAILLIVAFIFGIRKLFGGEKKAEEAKVEDTIQTKEFDYVLHDNKSDLYKEFFKKLKEELLKDEINDEEYAKLIAQLFVVDFYSLDDKKTNTDIGGLDFLLEESKDTFVEKAKNTIYKYIQSNIYGDRNQELPKIKSVEIKEISKAPMVYETAKDELGYKVVVSIEYTKDLGYPKEVTLNLIHQEKKIYIAEIK